MDRFHDCLASCVHMHYCVGARTHMHVCIHVQHFPSKIIFPTTIIGSCSTSSLMYPLKWLTSKMFSINLAEILTNLHFFSVRERSRLFEQTWSGKIQLGFIPGVKCCSKSWARIWHAQQSQRSLAHSSIKDMCSAAPSHPSQHQGALSKHWLGYTASVQLSLFKFSKDRKKKM